MDPSRGSTATPAAWVEMSRCLILSAPEIHRGTAPDRRLTDGYPSHSVGTSACSQQARPVRGSPALSGDHPPGYRRAVWAGAGAIVRTAAAVRVQNVLYEHSGSISGSRPGTCPAPSRRYALVKKPAKVAPRVFQMSRYAGSWLSLELEARLTASSRHSRWLYWVVAVEDNVGGTADIARRSSYDGKRLPHSHLGTTLRSGSVTVR
jgi:hypothetical protein